MRNFVIVTHSVTERTRFFVLEMVKPKHSVLLAIHIGLLVLLAERQNHIVCTFSCELSPTFYRHKAEADQGRNHDLCEGHLPKNTDIRTDLGFINGDYLLAESHRDVIQPQHLGNQNMDREPQFLELRRKRT